MQLGSHTCTSQKPQPGLSQKLNSTFNKIKTSLLNISLRCSTIHASPHTAPCLLTLLKCCLLASHQHCVMLSQCLLLCLLFWQFSFWSFFFPFSASLYRPSPQSKTCFSHVSNAVLSYILCVNQCPGRIKLPIASRTVSWPSGLWGFVVVVVFKCCTAMQ